MQDASVENGNMTNMVIMTVRTIFLTIETVAAVFFKEATHA